VLVVAGVIALGSGLAAPATAVQPTDPGNSADAPGQNKGAGQPAGNNGVLKVDGTPVDQPGNGDKNPGGQGHRDNEPHVSCVFNLDWYGFESGPGASTVAFELWGPNRGYALTPSGGSSVQVGGDSQGNADDQDATQQYDLTGALAAAKDAGAEPNDQQGWLVKVTVETDGLSQGADVKHKVFWVDDDCGSRSTTTTLGRNSDGTPPTPLVLGAVVTTTTTSPPTTEPPTTAPPTTAAATTGSVAVLGVQLARTGSDARVLLALAGLLMVAGGTALVVGRREEVTRARRA
jgi:LPXTG-motif cell wall-anchored protein